MRLEHLRRRGALEKLFIINEQGLEDLEIVGHGCASAVAAKTIFASWHQLGAFQRIVGYFSGILVSDRHASHASVDVRMLFGPERYVFDTQWLPDIRFHILLQRLAGDAFDQLAGPVEACAIKPAGAGLVDQRLSAGFFYGCTGGYFEIVRVLAITLDSLAHH